MQYPVSSASAKVQIGCCCCLCLVECVKNYSAHSKHARKSLVARRSSLVVFVVAFVNAVAQLSGEGISTGTYVSDRASTSAAWQLAVGPSTSQYLPTYLHTCINTRQRPQDSNFLSKFFNILFSRTHTHTYIRTCNVYFVCGRSACNSHHTECIHAYILVCVCVCV